MCKGECEPVFPPFGPVRRHLLHAAEIRFAHPDTGAPMTLTSSYATAFAECEYVAEHLLAEGLGPPQAPSGG